MTQGEGRRLLLVEDDADLGDLLERILGGAGYAVEVARDGQAGLHRGLTRTYDVMIVDRGLAGVEGADLVRRLRSQGVVTPILILTARGTPADRVEGLDAGAEDYVVKPFDVDELLARVRALLRRHTEGSASLSLGRLRLDVAARRVVGGGGPPVDLSARECELLRLLAAEPRRVFTRAEIVERVFAQTDSDNALDTYVYYLRRKLGRDVVRTVRGVGYQRGTT